MSGEFVIHVHTGDGRLHYDLMLPHGQSLATWQLATPPGELEEGQEIPAKRLPDHRSVYLTYEGPISGGRGQVEILDKGTFELLTEAPGHWTVRLGGCRTQGTFDLVQRSPDNEWIIRRQAD